MDIKLLKNSILTNSIPNFLIFNALNYALSKQYIKSISTTLNKFYKYYDSVDQVVYEVSTNLKDDYLFIVFNDESALNKLDSLEYLSSLKDRHVILFYDNLDLSSTLYKKYKDFCVTFKNLDKYTVLAYLMSILKNNKIEVSQDKIEKLVDFCDSNLSYCLNEVDKIISLNQASSNMVFDYMLTNGFSDYRSTNLFKFIQKILNKDLTLFDDLQRLDDNIISILTLLYKQVKLKLEKTNDVYYANILQLITELDCGIKDGSISDLYVLDYLLMRIL